MPSRPTPSPIRCPACGADARPIGDGPACRLARCGRCRRVLERDVATGRWRVSVRLTFACRLKPDP